MKSPIVLLGLLCASPAIAAPPADELLRYVPADATFCLVLRDLRSHSETLGKSPFAEQFRSSPLGKTLTGSAGLARLLQTEQFLENALGLSLDKLRDDVFGESIVFAYRQGPPGKPEQEQGLMLLRAKEAKPLADLVERLNKVLKTQVTEVEHAGFKYQRRAEGEEVNFLCLRGPVLIFSSQESLLREALALEKKTPANQPSAIAKSLGQLGADRALGAVWINPRAFDAELTARIKKADGAEKAFLETFSGCWKALDSAALTLSLTQDLEMGLALRGRPEALPKAVRRFFDDAAGAADLWARFPEDALLNFASRTPGASLLAFLGAFQTKKSFEAMQEGLNSTLGAILGGKDVSKDVLPHVGPDWGISVSAPARGEKGWFPAVFFALRIATGDPSEPVDRAIVDLIKPRIQDLVVAHNMARKSSLAYKTVRHEQTEFNYVGSSAGQAMGLQPAFGLSGGYLVIASTPETFRRFATSSRSGKSETEVPLLRLSFSAMRQYLKDYRQPLVAALAEHHKQSVQQTAQQVDEVSTALSLLDRVELTQRTTSGQVTFTLRVRPSQPLRK